MEIIRDIGLFLGFDSYDGWVIIYEMVFYLDISSLWFMLEDDLIPICSISKNFCSLLREITARSFRCLEAPLSLNILRNLMVDFMQI